MVTLTLTLTSENIFFLYGHGGHLYGGQKLALPWHYTKSRGVGSIRHHRGTVVYHRVPLTEDVTGGLKDVIEYHMQGGTLLGCISRSDARGGGVVSNVHLQGCRGWPTVSRPRKKPAGSGLILFDCLRPCHFMTLYGLFPLYSIVCTYETA